jgi:hypothetical protein
MLNRANTHITIDQGRGHAGITNIGRKAGYFDNRVQINTAEYDAGIHSGRPQSHEYLFTGMQTNASGSNDIFEGSLSDHFLGPGAFSQPTIARNFITQHMLYKEFIGVLTTNVVN